MREKVTIGKIWGIIYPILIHTAVSMVCVNVWYLIVYIVFSVSGEYGSMAEIKIKVNELYNDNILLVVSWVSVITIPIVTLFMKRDIDKDKLNGRFVKYKTPFVLKYLWIIPFGIFSMLAGNYFTSILAMFMSDSMIATYDSTQETIYGSSVALQILAAGIAGPIVEELIFRGLIYNRTKKMTGVIGAAILSSLIFGIYHGNWVQAPYAMIIGLVCVFVYEKYKSIVAPIILHISANMFSLLISQLASGMSSGETITPTFLEQLISLTMMTVITGSLMWLLGVIINKRVKAKEI